MGMFCPKCGAANDDFAASCHACGAALQSQQQSQPPQAPTNPIYGNPVPPADTAKLSSSCTTYLVLSIIATVLCCLPLGIPGIVFAAKARNQLTLNDISGVQEALKKAKIFTWLSFGLGLVMIILVVVLYGAFIAAIISQASYYGTFY